MNYDLSEDPEYPEDVFRDLSANCMDLLINVGLMNTIREHWPEHVQENWTEKMQSMNMWIHQQIEEVQTFAEAFDEGEES